MHALGTALGAVQTELKAARTTDAATAAAGESVEAKKTASEIGKALQKFEHETTQQVARETTQELFRTTKKPKHPKKLARAVIEGSTGEPTPPRTLQKKMESVLEQARNNKDFRTRNLPDGRIRYYEAEELSKTPGPTRGRSKVVEHNPKINTVRCWMECYDYNGNVNRVHPKMINGRELISQHYPATYQDILNNIKGMKWLTQDKN